MTWYDIRDKQPKAGDKIIAKLDRCYWTEMIGMIVREGDGLGHIKEWIHHSDVKRLYNDK